MIIDAAINLELNSTDIYDPYRSGVERDVFMKVGEFFPISLPSMLTVLLRILMGQNTSDR